MKYIDSEKLIAEIERRMDKHWEGLPDADSSEDDWTHNELCELGAYKELEHIEDFLDSLQQEQSEVDLDALVNEAFDKYSSVDGYGQLSVSFNRAELYLFIKKIAKKV